MPIKVTCPSCETVNKVGDDKAGKRVRCKECEEPISVPAPGAKKKSAKPMDDDAPKKGGSPMLLIALGGGALLLLLLCAGGGVGGYFLFFRTKPADDAKTMATNKGGGDQAKKKPEPKPPVEVKTTLPNETMRLAISPDGKHAIVSSFGAPSNKKAVEIWNLQTKTKMHDFSSDGCLAVAISPNSKYAAFTEVNGTTARIVDFETGADVKTLRRNGDPARILTASLRFSPNSDVLFRAAERQLVGWNVQKKGKLPDGESSGSGLQCMTDFFEDGKKVATADNSGKIQIWEIGKQQPVKTLSHKTNNPITRLAVSADGKTLVSNEWNNKLFVWDIAAGTNTTKTLADVPAMSSPGLLTPDGKMFIYATMKHKIVMFSIDSGSNQYELSPGTAGIEITAMALTADGTSLVSLSKDNTIRIWDIKDLK